MNKLTHTIKDVGIIITVKVEGDTADSMKSRQYTIPSELVTVHNGSYFVTLSRKSSTVRRLITCQALKHVEIGHADEGMGTSDTDIPDKLANLREMEIRKFCLVMVQMPQVCTGDGKTQKGSKPNWQISLMCLPSKRQKSETLTVLR